MSSSFLSAGRAADQGVLSLHDKGWPNLCGRRHLRQCGLSCPCHSPGHQVITRVQKNRDHLSFSLCFSKSRVQTKGGWVVANRSCFQPLGIKRVPLNEVGQRPPWLVAGASSALNQTVPHPFVSSFSERVYTNKKTTAPKTCQSWH